MEIKLNSLDLWAEIIGTKDEKLTYYNWLNMKLSGGGYQMVKGRLFVLTGALLSTKLLESEDNLLDDEKTKVDGWLSAAKEAGILRDYQADAVLSALNCPLGRGIIKAPPGAGKTRICAGIVALGAMLGLPRWHYVVKNNELASQAKEEIESTTDMLLEICGQNSTPCAFSASSFAKMPKQVDGLLVDECHGLAARTRAEAYAGTSSAYRIGLSGTPLDRSDDKNNLVLGLLGPIVYEINRDKLVELNCLAASTVHQVKISSHGWSSRPVR